MMIGSKLVEVKSLESAGLYTSPYFYKHEELFYMLKAKAKASLRAGYDFRLLIMSADGSRVKLPKDWYAYSRESLMQKL